MSDIIDIDELRALFIQASGPVGMDDTFTLYYDETNNIRRLHVTEAGFNVADPACFVLGGVCHDGGRREFDLSPLRRAVRAQPTMKELKLMHIGKGDFLDVLASPRLESFLSWLANEGLFVHYAVLDPVYWSVVDIIDSVLPPADAGPLEFHRFGFKTALLLALRDDLQATATLFRRYGYPDIKSHQVRPFLDEIIERVVTSARLKEFDQQMLKGVLQMGYRLPELVFLKDEPASVLIQHFTSVYLNRICLLKNADHVLDMETEITRRLAGLTLISAGRPLRNFRFVENSEDEPGVQISDVVVGLLGKFFTWMTTTDGGEVEIALVGLSKQAERNRSALAHLLDRSAERCPVFAQRMISLEEERKGEIFLRT